jgi:hypothetical protein
VNRSKVSFPHACSSCSWIGREQVSDLNDMARGELSTGERTEAS